MSKTKKFFSALAALIIVIALAFAAWFASSAEKKTSFQTKDVTIIYTNDIHTYIKNRDENDAKKALNFSYSALSAMKKDFAAQGREVLLVDAGDHIQGTPFGDTDKGATIIQLMNETGYDIATLGNHEFDYGIPRIFELIKKAEFPYVSCNFYKVESNELVLSDYKIIEKGGAKIAFIGISTPESITKSTPTFFMDKNGSLLYDFYAGEDGSDLYNAVQKTINKVRSKVDYVIAIGHLGVDISSSPFTSREVIAKTHGLDAFIDGHSHTLVEHENVKDAEGNNVLLTQTGAYFKGVGVMTLAKTGEIKTEILSRYDKTDAGVATTEQGWINTIKEKLDEQIAFLEDKMYVMDPKNPSQRIVRLQETNLGDLTADAYYYYFNEKLKIDCDLSLSNGGGIRNGMEKGLITYLTAKTVQPFGNQICVVETTGQQVKDALEKGAMFVGVYNPSKNMPAESGGFMHVAGLKYEIDSTIDSTVPMDDNGIWLGQPSGRYKVVNIQVYNRETEKYEPIDLKKTYRVAGCNYTLKNLGDGMAMFKGNNIILDFVGEDYMILAEYLKAFKKGSDGYPHVSTENSPLSSYKNYLLDYKNPYGSGRIEINK